MVQPSDQTPRMKEHNTYYAKQQFDPSVEKCFLFDKGSHEQLSTLLEQIYKCKN